MKRTDITYGQLEKVLRALGFTCRPGHNDPPGRIYEHKMTGAIVMLPAFPESDKVYEHHLVAARMELDDFGIANPTDFEAKLRKAECGSMSTTRTVIDGLLKPDGTLELDTAPRLPPGRFRVTLQPISEGRTGGERLPDSPWLDDCIPAPFDLPRPGATERVQPRAVSERLPELPIG